MARQERPEKRRRLHIGVADSAAAPYFAGMTENRRATRWRSPDEPCLNCGDSTPGRFCPTCGQRKAEVLVSVHTLLADVLEDQLVLNRALPRTLGLLLFHPGFLTEEYVRGRIVRYIAPFRLYLVSSVVFFLLLSFIGLQGLDINTTATGDDGGVIDSAATRDSVLAGLNAALADIDTAGMPPAAQTALRQRMADAAAAIQAAADTTASDAIGSEATFRLDADTALPPGTFQPWARQIQFDGSSPHFERALQRKLAQVAHLPMRDAMISVLRDLLEFAPHMVFLLLPVFAFILKLLYIRRSRFYAEHFVFALHVHAFVFVMFTVMFILPWDWINGLLTLWIAVYVWLALRRVYRQGWFRTTVKWWTLGTVYLLFFSLGVIGLAVATLLLT